MVGGSILDVINGESSFGDSEDVDMMDVEEGEFVGGQFLLETSERNEKESEAPPQNFNAQTANGMNKNKKKKKKKKSKKSRVTRGPSGFDLDRFVIDVCKRLKEKKSYLVYTAVGVLGASAFSVLVKEVDAIQACGGQKTAQGNRYRTGGGIVWNILKTRDPNAYREIMKKGKDFEKQFRQPSGVTPPQNNVVSHDAGPVTIKPMTYSPEDEVEMKTPAAEGLSGQPTREIRRSVHDRIRVPVSYDDLPGEESPKDQLS